MMIELQPSHVQHGKPGVKPASAPAPTVNPLGHGVIVLLNYTNAALTCRCLDSLKSLTEQNFSVVVVDNASPDDSVSILRQHLAKLQAEDNPFACELLCSPENGGYAAGNNFGLRYALSGGLRLKADPSPDTPAAPPALPPAVNWFWLLNNDTVVTPDALTHLLEAAQQYHQRHQVYPLVGSWIQYPDGRFQQAATQMNRWTGQLRGMKPERIQPLKPVDAITGASMWVSAETLQQLGLMEESYFLYCEDVALCLRAQKMGVPSIVAANSIVLHEEGATTGKQSARSQYYFQRNRLRLMLEQGHWLQRVTVLLYTGYRYVRSMIKASQSPERLDAHHILTHALRDALNGVTGPYRPAH